MKISSEEIVKKLRDPKYYLENFTQIKTKEKGLAPFILNEAQKDLFNTLNEFCRIIICKVRQLGFSTAVTGYFYVKAITTPGVNIALIGYNADMTAELLDKVKTFYKTTPLSMRPAIQYNSRYEISFPKMDSKILVLPSTENVGRGYTLHYVLASEVAMWDKAEDKMVALEAAVPINGKLVIESTPSGTGNLYHRTWVTDNDYVKKEYGWWWGYSKEEIDIIEKRMNNPLKFSQEYGLKFLTSGRSVFDQNAIEEQRKNVLKVGDKNGEFTVIEEDGWIIYTPPKPDRTYVCSGDVSEGVEGGDYSVGTIVDRTTGEEVAHYRGLIAPDRFGEKLDVMGRKYNNALMIVEINNQGLLTVTTLRNRLYPSMYFRPGKLDTMGTQFTDRIGWRTTKVTRPLMIGELGKAVRDKDIIIHTKIILDEMSVFVYDDDNNMIAPRGFHDDCIFSVGLALQGFKVLYSGKLDQLDYHKYLPKSSAY